MLCPLYIMVYNAFQKSVSELISIISSTSSDSRLGGCAGWVLAAVAPVLACALPFVNGGRANDEVDGVKTPRLAPLGDPATPGRVIDLDRESEEESATLAAPEAGVKAAALGVATAGFTATP